MKISDATSISMPMRNLISIVAAVAVGVWAYFGIIERLNKLETGQVLLDKDMTAEDTRLHTEVTKNTEFRIKYPRGELGQSQNDLEQFMLIEELYKQVEKMEKVLESNMTNKVNIDFLKEQTDKMLSDIEKLKDRQREFANGDH
jgi:hypothetical protein|tara:strand:- start:380 stop:811 length:432 start_codon:yes stop_codon:yes gene_type:complete